jgi:serine phosphatase RsbU (regulator of sigma subunit)
MMEELGAREMIVVPIALESDHGAVLIVTFDSDQVSRRDIELAEAVGNEIALSFDNAFFYQQALTRADNLETVFRISQTVGSSLEVKVVLDRVLDVVQKILSADAVALMTYDARLRTMSTEMARGAVSPSIVERMFKPGDDIIGYVFESGEPVSLRDMSETMGGIAGDAARHGLQSMLAVPLLARGRSLGVLTVFSASEGAFGEEDMNLLRTFASQAALAIDTARLYSREHEVASVLQRSLLPEALPNFPELEAASVYEPAGGEAEIGGDYYDLFRAPDSTIWLSIADVCGKGVRAATKTSMIKYAVRSLVAAGFSPGRVIGEVNRMVAEAGDASDIVTLWVGRVDVGRGRMMWSAGGHPPGLLRRGDSGEIVQLASTGPLLGAIMEVTYTDESTSIRTGDALILYTDGVTEARSGNTFFGEERVQCALEPGGTAADVVDRLTTAVRRFVQSDFRDDVAVLAVRIVCDTGTAPQFEEERPMV